MPRSYLTSWLCWEIAEGIFHADATNGSPAGGMPYPTGVLAPAQCRFKLLTPALR